MNKKLPLKQGFVTGLISGVFAVGAFIIFNNLNNHLNWGFNPATLRGAIGLLTIVILAIGIYAGMRSIKKANNGKLSYGNAILAGLTVGVITGFSMAVIVFVYYHFVNPGYTDYMVNEGRKAMIAAGESPDQVSYHTNALRQEFSPTGQAIQAVFGQSVCGLIISLVMGIFVRSK